MDFYKLLIIEKSSRNLNNKRLGDIIGMKGEAFRMAIKRRSLNQFQQNLIIDFFKENQTKIEQFENINFESEIKSLEQNITFLKEKVEDKEEQINILKEQNKLLQFKIEFYLKEIKEQNIEIKNIVETHHQFNKLLHEISETENTIKKTIKQKK